PAGGLMLFGLAGTYVMTGSAEDSFAMRFVALFGSFSVRVHVTCVGGVPAGAANVSWESPSGMFDLKVDGFTGLFAGKPITTRPFGSAHELNVGAVPVNLSE